jgi:heterotetrameric sarcosine oxidase delta subunit
MLIRCPICGERSFSEFVYGGGATVTRPADPAATSDVDWHAYLYLRDNARGPHREWWFHEFGCEEWVEVTRDTLTHEISSASLAGGGR